MFGGRKLVIATKHRKENAIAPLLEKELGVSCFASENFDTDLLGTFTGEIERQADVLATLRRKCLMAMDLNNCDLGVASEGSFGMHPSLFFIPADEEFLIFIDRKNDLEIIERELSTETNFKAAELTTKNQLTDFAISAKSPSHALILRKSAGDTTEIMKGINNWENLEKGFEHFINKHGSAFAETDMRALYNPTRMEVIGAATKKLITKIQSLCPQCSTPGFGITSASKGLPCSSCGFETQSIVSYLRLCTKCGFSTNEMYPQHKTTEDPMYCDVCNP